MFEYRFIRSIFSKHPLESKLLQIDQSNFTGISRLCRTTLIAIYMAQVQLTLLLL